jgi:small-conductance mechanosensitive channel
MRSQQKTFAILLILLLGALAFGIVRTGQQANSPIIARRNNHAPSPQSQLVDQSPLITAQALARLANTEEEQPLAQEALRLSDYEVDLAFDAALHNAKEHPPILQGEAKEIADRLEKAEAVLVDAQARVNELSQAAAKATGDKKDKLDDDVAVAEEDVNLAQDEVDDAKQDLIRAGGDPESRIQELQKEHKDAEQQNKSSIASVSTAVEPPGLIHRIQQWSALHAKQMQLWQAKGAADGSAAWLATQHTTLDEKVEQEKINSPHLAHHAKKTGAKSAVSKQGSSSAPPSGNAAAPNSASAAAQAAAPATPATSAGLANLSHEESAELLEQTKHIAAGQKALSNFDKRIDTQKELSAVYSEWIGVVAANQRGLVRRMLIGLAIIFGILLVGLFFDGWVETLLGKTSLDRRQVETLRTVTRVSVQVVAVLFILLVIFGPPGQLGTFLGLAGAGLTVALKDFIVGFIGWFVLMGKNGIRLGDWVEINGVTGEVVELGMFHTVLLETGNWTDSGHPTGRRVTFTNSFAIEGHYFNFSTSGQWLWDELQVVLPAGKDPYPIIDAIQKKVMEATSQSASQAEQEWKSAARSRDLSSLTAAPAINLKPVVGGVEIAVRYITRANERYQMRAKLYQAAVDLLGANPGVPS